MSAVPPTAGAPVKIPMKMPMKIAMKVPIAAAGVKFPVAAPRPAAPAAPVAVAKPAVVKPKVEFDDDDLLLPAKKSTPVKVAAKRARSPSPSSSSSSSSESRDDGYDSSDEDTMTLYMFAKKNKLLVNEFKSEDLEAPMELGGPAPPPRQKVSSNIDADIQKLRDQIAKIETNMQIKEDTKTVSLGTSKTNYIDPRIVYAFSKRMGVETKKLLSATLHDKFQWAHATEPDYRF